MRIYANCLEAVKEVERDLAEMGTIVTTGSYQDVITDDPQYDTLELVAYSYTILDASDKDQMLGYLSLPKDYAVAEFADRLSESYNPGNSWKLRKEVWEPFLNDRGRFSYTYSERLNEQDQLQDTISVLASFPLSRQGVVPVYSVYKDTRSRRGLARIPCSMYYHFFQRDGKVVLIYNMRSCDFKTHFGYDVWLATELQAYVARELNLPTGPFIHQVGSLHMFRKDAEGVF